jgi:hypothetical protein
VSDYARWLVSLKFARAGTVSARERESDGKRDNESGENAKLPEDRLKIAAFAQDALGLCGNDQHAPYDRDETDYEERFKDELRSSKRESQGIEQLRNDEHQKYAIKNQQC